MLINANGIMSIDHPVIAVNSLDAARVVYERLGFTVPPRGSHVEWGTGNLCIMFPSDYLEMRGIIDPARFTMNLDQHLQEWGEGLMGVAFRTDDVADSYRQLLASGVETSEPRKLTRNFEHPEGWTQPSFELCVPTPDAIDGLMHVVVLQHLTPELIRTPQFLQHANTAKAVTSVTGIIHDIDTTAAKMSRLVGADNVAVSERGVVLSISQQQTISLLIPEKYAEHFGDNPSFDGRAQLGAMEICVADLDRARDLLTRNDVIYNDKAANVIRVDSGQTCGVILDFVE